MIHHNTKFAVLTKKRTTITGKIIPREVIELEPRMACIPSAINKEIVISFKPKKKFFHKTYKELLFEKQLKASF